MRQDYIKNHSYEPFSAKRRPSLQVVKLEGHTDRTSQAFDLGPTMGPRTHYKFQVYESQPH